MCDCIVHRNQNTEIMNYLEKSNNPNISSYRCNQQHVRFFLGKGHLSTNVYEKSMTRVH